MNTNEVITRASMIKAADAASVEIEKGGDAFINEMHKKLSETSGLLAVLASMDPKVMGFIAIGFHLGYHVGQDTFGGVPLQNKLLN